MTGSNCTSIVAAWPEVSVTGKVTPETVKPVPVSVVALTVTEAVPVDVKVTDCVELVFTVTSPKARLVALRLSAGIAVETVAFNCSAKLLETLPAVAVSVAVCEVVTDDTVAANSMLVALPGIVTVAGTVTAALLLDRLTLKPSLGAAALSATVHVSVPAPVMDSLLQESELSVAAVTAVTPVPFSAIVVVLLVEELLVMVN